MRRSDFSHRIDDTALQLRLDLGWVFRRPLAASDSAGVDLCAAGPDCSDCSAHQAARQRQHPKKLRLDLCQKPLPERPDRILVGIIVSRDEPECPCIISSDDRA